MKMFLRNKLFLIMMIIAELLVIGFYLFVYRNKPSEAIIMTAYGQMLLTLIFMTMGIELKSAAKKDNIDILFDVYNKKPWFYKLCRLICLFVFIIFSFLIISVVFIIIMKLDDAPIEWIVQSFSNLTLLYLIPSVVLAVWGLLIGNLKNDRYVYLIALSVWLLTSSLNTEILIYLQNIDSENIRFLLSIFNMGNINIVYPLNYYIGLPIEQPRYIVRLIILLFLLLFLFLYRKKETVINKKHRKSRAMLYTSAIVLAFFSFTYIISNYYVFFTNFADGHDVWSETDSISDKYISGQPVSLNDFNTKKNISIYEYDLDLDFSHKGLRATATVYATTDKNINKQSFTLYSGMEIESVKVDGEIVEFERSHDGIMIYLNNNKNKNEQIVIEFIYGGYSLPIYPANETYVQLNNSFPYIPWPGIKTTDKYANFYSYSNSDFFFVEDWQMDENIFFTLEYGGPNNLYTNLEKTDNHYEGYSSIGVYLYSKMLSLNYRDIDIYYPAIIYEDRYLAVDALIDSYSVIEDLCTRMDVIIKPVFPQEIILIEMETPTFNEEVYSCGLYSKGGVWELRYASGGGGTPGIVWYRDRFGTSQEEIAEYQNSDYIKSNLPVAYIFSECCGFPTDTSHLSVYHLSAWMSIYLKTYNNDAADLSEYEYRLVNSYSGDNIDIIWGKSIEKQPLSDDEKSCISDILHRMQNGEDFDNTFKYLYHKLIDEEIISISEIVNALNSNQEE